jgi:hypothetical protein
MGTSCRCPYSSQKESTTIETEPKKKNDNTISLEYFFNLIPKKILEKMQTENMLFYNDQNKLELKTVEITKNKNNENNEQIFYHGDFNQKDEREGIGKMVIINSNNESTYYHGIWQKDELKKGVIYYPNNSEYKGEIKNLLKNGKGMYTSETEKYDGDWKNDLKDGEGLLIYIDGIKYKGQFKKDKFNGKGEMTWPNGTYYLGEFCNNTFHGKGYLKGSNAHTYSGNFSRGLFSGEGEFIWTKGVNMRRYKGNYSSGKKDGLGELYFDHGDVFKGTWESGTPHGEGIYETKNRKYYGNWRSGIFMQLIKVENKEGCEEENINLNFITPIEDIEIKSNYFKMSNNSVFSSTYNTYNDVFIELIKPN